MLNDNVENHNYNIYAILTFGKGNNSHIQKETLCPECAIIQS